MSVASKRLSGPVGGCHGHTMGTAVLASAAAVRRQAGARQALLVALFIRITPCSPYLRRLHQHV
jgi:hypothetical protein